MLDVGVQFYARQLAKKILTSRHQVFLAVPAVFARCHWCLPSREHQQPIHVKSPSNLDITVSIPRFSVADYFKPNRSCRSPNLKSLPQFLSSHTLSEDKQNKHRTRSLALSQVVSINGNEVQPGGCPLAEISVHAGDLTAPQRGGTWSSVRWLAALTS